MFSILKNSVKKLLSIGVYPELTFIEKVRVELCNLMAILGLTVVILNMLINLCSNKNLSEYVISICFITCIFIILTFNHLRRHNVARFVILGPPVVLVLIKLNLFGHQLNNSCYFIFTIVAACYLLKLRHAIFYSILVIVSVTMSSIYLINYEPINAHIVVKDDPVIYMLFTAIITLILTTRLIITTAENNKVIEKQNKLLQEKNKELESFTYIASHDLKSPLINILSFVKLLKKDAKNQKYNNVATYSDIIESSAKQMKILIEDVLELTKTNRSDTENRTTISLEIALNTAVNNLTSFIDSRDVELNFAILPNYLGHHQDFVQIFQNLIQNGIKYNQSEHPKIEVDFKLTEETLFITFKDNGIGIDEEYHDQIFEFFKRLHNQKIYKGSGLGLGLCQKIINQYNGNISVKSKVGKGSIFLIELPFVEQKAEERNSLTEIVYHRMTKVDE